MKNENFQVVNLDDAGAKQLKEMIETLRKEGGRFDKRPSKSAALTGTKVVMTYAGEDLDAGDSD
ncbi:MAG: hypothetical protein AAF633_21175 [Chloroflexota bacterium]